MSDGLQTLCCSVLRNAVCLFLYNQRRTSSFDALLWEKKNPNRRRPEVEVDLVDLETVVMVTAFVAETISHPLLCDCVCRVSVFVQTLEEASCNYGREVALAGRREKLHQPDSKSRKRVLIHHAVSECEPALGQRFFFSFFFFSSNSTSEETRY